MSSSRDCVAQWGTYIDIYQILREWREGDWKGSAGWCLHWSWQMRKVLTGEWQSGKVMSEAQNKKAQGHSGESWVMRCWVTRQTKTARWGMFCGGRSGRKVQGNLIGRTLQSHSPHIDANCHGGRLEPRADKEAVGACVFRSQVRSEWQVALSISRRNIWEMRWWECQPGWGDECGREMAAWGGNQKQYASKFFCLFVFLT